MKKILAFVYGMICYIVFFGTFLYMIGFLSNQWVPKSIDSGTTGPAGWAFFIDILLIALFGIQHSVMARPKFKMWWTRIIPEPIERSTFVLIASFLLILLFSLWQPIPTEIWSIENLPGQLVSYALFFSGWILVIFSSFLINHFDLFGLRQVYLYLAGKPYTPLPFKIGSLYQRIRHPMMLGFIIVLWATPKMTVGHLVFAVGFTVYIFIGTAFEEHDMAGYFGETYEKYRHETSMILPSSKRK